MSVCILYTGGTVGMKKTSQGYAPAPGYLEEQMAVLSEFASPVLPAHHIVEFSPLLDSSNMTPADWLKIAQAVAQYYAEYDGFVVIHGTDTMAYTASALAFLLEGLGKPVILTGSQIPLCEVRSDAVENLITALLIAGNYPIPEVCLYFGGKLLRGCRAIKTSASGMSAFDSPNYSPLGLAGIDLVINWNAVTPPPPPGTPLVVQDIGSAPDRPYPLVGVLKLFPGIPAWMVRNALQPPLQGVVLESYGTGTGPDHDADLLQAIQEATGRGIVIVGVTQCQQGTVNLGAYSTSSSLAKAGVTGGLDMTTEAALTKLFYLFCLGYPSEKVRQMLSANLRGEFTPARPGWLRGQPA